MQEQEPKMAVNKENDTWHVVIYGRCFKGTYSSFQHWQSREEWGTKIQALDELFTEC